MKHKSQLLHLGLPFPSHRPCRYVIISLYVSVFFQNTQPPYRSIFSPHSKKNCDIYTETTTTFICTSTLTNTHRYVSNLCKLFLIIHMQTCKRLYYSVLSRKKFERSLYAYRLTVPILISSQNSVCTSSDLF